MALPFKFNSSGIAVITKMATSIYNNDSDPLYTGFITEDAEDFRSFLVMSWEECTDYAQPQPYMWHRKGTVVDIASYWETYGWGRLQRGSAMFLGLKVYMHSRDTSEMMGHGEKAPIRFTVKETRDDFNQHGWASPKTVMVKALGIKQIWLQGDKKIEENIPPVCYNIVCEGTGEFSDLLTSEMFTLPNGARIYNLAGLMENRLPAKAKVIL